MEKTGRDARLPKADPHDEQSPMYWGNVQAYHAAGQAGIGLIQAGYLALAHHIKSGELVEILPDLRPEQLSASLVVAHRRNLSQRVRAFMTWIEGVWNPILISR